MLTPDFCLCSPNMLLSGSRDKTLIIWNLTRDESQYGYPKRSLHGHSHIVSDCVRSFSFFIIFLFLVVLCRFYVTIIGWAGKSTGRTGGGGV